MCIAFDGAYILEAPPANPGIADDHRRPAPEVTPEVTPAVPTSEPEPAAAPDRHRATSDA
jgi:hypothetical protein